MLTDRGERVRSKSELIIANLLSKEGIPYKYECPLRLKGFGTVHPDFTALRRNARREIYWEHLGMMDDPEYTARAVRKISAYILNGFYPGEDLIITAETNASPINIRELRDYQALSNVINEWRLKQKARPGLFVLSKYV